MMTIRLYSNLTGTTLPGGARRFYLTGLICDYLSVSLVFFSSLSGSTEFGLENKEIIIGLKYAISIASYSEGYKELLSLECDEILLDILLFTSFLRVSCLSLSLTYLYSQCMTALTVKRDSKDGDSTSLSFHIAIYYCTQVASLGNRFVHFSSKDENDSDCDLKEISK
ncbi:hypothetical protein PHYBLDRAFT_165700 [Phycomyces blakesleeanus NRRL 1555(-)]|uniref:Uncharacterized protein n=1 Tax=Phycomyces blakesleeanus (strain ATCC 8743b / DSM 1359 / FGSC 10004 / NBRC 33097 / NRRL 1555) TaxID=763407 RepID=A0A162UNN4_PHYB8|nr:hypothetical protein PHYBLDRAFT_165700 [Phycomyces blakesleeanus NRRL 1555(-)]OAD77212.1 hypothetical protein PHYBLDRAFT_165700 [Phycomyces blakesleeanus NRRL 1555(-)]|eukprot:XP_018295252.1 hypothetical protein PHYBLDRAFT_165700 [Phycomyces blakesleeanus NRRL 1555(-)]